MTEPEKKHAGKERERDRWSRKVRTVLRAVRDDADVTQEELAGRLGLSHRQVVNLENGHRAVHVVDLFMIAQALNVDPEELVKRIIRW